MAETVTDWHSRSVLITGAASGIGRVTALKLASLGARVGLIDLNRAVADVLREIRKKYPDSASWAAFIDVSDEEKVEHYVGEYAEIHGLDHVFNCAGINPTAYPLLETPPGYFDKLVATNIKGIYNVTRAALNYLPEKKKSSFVNVSSIMGVHPSPNNSIYCATKWAVIGFSKSLALELGPKGIRVNVIAPGFIDTPTNASVVAGQQAIKDAESKVAMGRMGTAEEIADVVVFLFSDAARYMNGSVIEVNGGTG